MPTISELFSYASLSEAAYINLSSTAWRNNPVAVGNAAVAQERLARGLADATFANSAWQVVGYNDADNSTTGFAATMFKGPNERYVLGVRGTEDGVWQTFIDLLWSDLKEIGYIGLALSQTVSMVNFILRLQAPTSNSNVLQFDLQSSSLPTPPAATNYIGGPNGWFWLTPRATGAQGLGAIPVGAHIDVTGHSLGGHLAAMAARLFPGLIDQAVIFNAPGFDPATAGVLQTAANVTPLGQVMSAMLPAQKLTDEAIGMFGHYLPVAPAAAFRNVTSFESEDLAPGQETDLISGIVTGMPSGPEYDVSVEVKSHGMGQIVDSLAFQQLLARLDTGLGLDSFEILNRIASNSDTTALEMLLVSLERLLKDPNAAANLPIVEAGTGVPPFVRSGDFVARSSWYQRWKFLHDALTGNPSPEMSSVASLPGKVIITYGTPSQDFPAAANSDFGEFIALKTLAPFAFAPNLNVVGAAAALDAVWNQVHHSDFVAWSDDKTMRDRGDEAPALNFSDTWYGDRAEMLRRLLTVNQDNEPRVTDVPSSAAQPTSFGNDETAFVDLAQGIEIRQRAVDSKTSYVIFGSEYGEIGSYAIKGAAERDDLYGGGGDDELQGLAGDDYIEGNEGNDVLAGGAGNDTLRGGKGLDRYVLGLAESGADTIADSDNSGRLVVDGTEIAGFNATGRNAYQSTGAGVIQLVVSDNGDGTQSAGVFESSTGRLLANIVGIKGASILGYELPPQPSTTFQFSYIRGNDPDNYRMWVLQGARDQRGNILEPSPSPASAVADGGGGNDLIVGGTFAREEIRGGSGNDTLWAFDLSNQTADAAQVTTLLGGDGSDYIRGGGKSTYYIDGGIGDDFVETLRHEAPALYQFGRDASGQIYRPDWRMFYGVPYLLLDLGNAISYRPVFNQGDERGYDDANFSRTSFFTNRFLPGTYTPLGLQHGDENSYYVTASGYFTSVDQQVAPLMGFDETEDPNDSSRVVSYRLIDAPDDPRNVWIDVTLKSGKTVLGMISRTFRFEGTQAEIDAQIADAKLDGTGNDASIANVSLGDGRDFFEGGSGRDVVDGGRGNDSMDGGGGNDFLQGGDGDDYVSGGRYADVLHGGNGSDQLHGGGEGDFLFGGPGNDFLYGEYAFTTSEPSGDDWLDGGEGQDQLSGGLGADSLFGGADNDILISEGKDRLLDGGSGDDVYLIQDYTTTQCEYIGNLIFDKSQVREMDGNGHDLLVSNFFRADLPSNVEDMFIQDLGIQGGAISGSDWKAWGGDTRAQYSGNSANNSIDARAAGNNPLMDSLLGGVLIDGGGGADRMMGGSANDTYVVDNSGDVVEDYGLLPNVRDKVKSSVSWTLSSAIEDLELTGDQATEGTGTALDNVLDASGNKASNTLRGGLGGDTYVIGLNDVVVENSAAGNDTVVIADGLGATNITARVSDFANVENLQARFGSGVSTLIGDAGANKLVAGGSGTVDGGAGDDILVDLNSGDYYTRGVELGFDLLYLPGAGATLLGGTGNDTLTSVSGDSVLDGGGGNDLLNGWTPNGDRTTYVFGSGYGADRIDDGSNSDSVSYPTSTINLWRDNVRITDATDARQLRFSRSGNDLVMSIAGTTADTLTVSAFWNADGTIRSTVDTIKLLGGGILARDSILKGLLGGSRTTATTGDDLLIASTTTATTLSGGNGADHLIGGAQADTLRGDAGNDYLSGGTGNDTLDGGTGDDVMAGGDGDDIYVVDSAADVAIETYRQEGKFGNSESGYSGNDTVRASVSYQIGTAVENLELTGTASVNATGNYLANRLRGNSGANRLDGGLWSADDMAGGTGNDTYVVDNFGDLVTEFANEGTDTVEVSEDYFTNSNFYTLDANVENLVLTGTNGANGLGNALANSLVGNDGDNRLEGYAGIDTFQGGLGSDMLVSLGQGSRFVFNRGDGRISSSTRLPQRRHQARSSWAREYCRPTSSTSAEVQTTALGPTTWSSK